MARKVRSIRLENLLWGFRPWFKPHYRDALALAAKEAIALIRELDEEIRLLKKAKNPKPPKENDGTTAGT